MTTFNKYLLLILMGCFGLISFKATHSFFSNAAASNNNTFTAAAVFPTPTPTASPSSSPSSSPSASPSPSPTPPANIANHVVISEVQIDSAGGSTHDFVELYNPTSSLINLNGYRIAKRDSNDNVDRSTDVFVFSNSDIILAHGFYLWSSKADNYNLTIGADVSSSESLSSNTSIALRNGPHGTGTIVDALAWGTPTGPGVPLVEGSAFPSNPGNDKSMERKAYSTSTISSMLAADANKGNGFDTDHNSTDFLLRAVSQPQNSSSATETP